MFSLFHGCYEYMTRKEEIHLLLIGLDKAGKTTLLERLKTLYTDYSGLEPQQILPTVGLNIARFEVQNTPLVLWDLGGQAQLRSIWEKYFAESHALVYVVDASDVDRIAEAKIVMDKALGNRDLHGAPLLVLANKQDAPGAVAAVELRERLGLGKFDSRVSDVQSCSALNGDGLKTAVDWLVDRAKRSQRAELLKRKA